MKTHYRILEAGEAIQEGDQVKINGEQWAEASKGVGLHVGINWAAEYRRPVDINTSCDAKTQREIIEAGNDTKQTSTGGRLRQPSSSSRDDRSRRREVTTMG